jgi:hypothetical protein
MIERSENNIHVGHKPHDLINPYAQAEKLMDIAARYSPYYLNPAESFEEQPEQAAQTLDFIWNIALLFSEEDEVKLSVYSTVLDEVQVLSYPAAEKVSQRLSVLERRRQSDLQSAGNQPEQFDDYLNTIELTRNGRTVTIKEQYLNIAAQIDDPETGGYIEKDDTMTDTLTIVDHGDHYALHMERIAERNRARLDRKNWAPSDTTPRVTGQTVEPGPRDINRTLALLLRGLFVPMSLVKPTEEELSEMSSGNHT